MLHVLCDPSELDEDGVVIEVGEVVSRLAVPNTGKFYASALDDAPYRFDRYARATRDSGAVLVTGRVVAIDAIYTTLESADGLGGHPVPGSARTEPLRSTGAGPRPQNLDGWRFTLDAPTVRVDPPT